ncbi:putative serine protease PepD [Nonomuraea solani]|uniref:Putative serine protease PepD n=1 Tax=Nonomuraea solani TaxID=1144553 RepID=A0A1H6EWR5_9ACTN|nr:trypsin-like peptidase domain-containing protein [Nonomuraea solani]SEH02222.1 putative serine protease PepD [Nonomuraea solani]
MNANEPREQGPEEQGTGGWSQFGTTPPAAGGFPRRDTHIMPQLPPPPPAEPKKARFTAGQKAIAGLALAAMAIGGGTVGAVVATSLQPTPVLTSASAPSPAFKPASDQLTVSEVAAKVQPTVVMIQGQTGEGSGVVLSEDGLILTNNHVAVGATGQGGGMTVKFSDGKTAKAAVVGTDPTTDLAVIRAEGVSGLTKATLGDSDQLKVGDAVLAIGSPLGLDGSVTAGIISALDRTLTLGNEQRQQIPPGWGQQQEQSSAPTTIGGAIQTDASINPGNSGGALVNAAGQLVGINTAIASEAAGGGVGFAIPVNMAKQVAEQLISSGKVSHAFLGVSVTDATGDVPGALISQVTQGSPAEKAGLQQGDLITKIGDKAVDAGDTVVGQVRGFKPGQQVKITYMRDGKAATVDVTLAEKK